MPKKNTAARKPARPYHHGNLRRALLDEALATIRNEGVEAVTLREIGARVGVSRTALYRHFADKSALIAAVAAEGFRTLREQLVTAWERNNGGLAGFEAMGFAYVHFAVANSTHFRVMFSRFIYREPADPALATEGAGAFMALVNAVTELQRRRELRADDTELMARHIWAVVHGVANLAIDGQLPEPDGIEKLTRYSIDRLLLGIAQRSDMVLRTR
jgi:AcrR family transcriptional regulator